MRAMRGLGVAALSALLLALVVPPAPALPNNDWAALLGGDADVIAGLGQDDIRALHREHDKNWRHRAGSAAAEPAADEEEVVEGNAGAGEQEATPEDSLQPKRRRYNRKRPRPGQVADADAVDEEPKRRKDDGEEAPRRKPTLRRRRPHRPDSEVDEDDADGRQAPSSTTENVATPVDLKSLLKQTAGQLSLSELLQNRNLSLADLLKGNRGALSALAATPSTETPQPPPQPTRTTSTSATSATSSTSATSTASSDVSERPNGFVPSKPRRLPPVPRPHTTIHAPTPSQEPEITTSRPRRLPAVVARLKEERDRERDALDPMSPAMMAMITLEAADTHTSKPRRIPSLAPTLAPTLPPSTPDAVESSSTTTAREFYPLNVDSLEITTPRLMGVPKPKEGASGTQTGSHGWMHPADRIIDAQVFSPGSIPSKFKPHGFVLPTTTDSPASSSEEPSAGKASATSTSAPPAATATLQNTSDHFRLENETLDMKEGNALDKRKIAPPRPFLRPVVEGHGQVNATATAPVNVNELDKDKEREKLDKRKQLVGSGPRRLPPTLAGSRRLPAVNRPKSTTETPKEAVTEKIVERPRLPGLLGAKRPKDTLLPPTRFALPLPEIISIDKMIADAKSRGALADQSDGTSTSTTPSTTTTFTSHDEILDLLKSEQSSARLSRILAERNMTLEDLLQHRERGSSQLHFADFFRNATADTGKKAAAADLPVDLVPREIAPAERKESVNILRSFHEVPKYPFSYSGADDSEEAASTLSLVNIKPSGIVLPADPGERFNRAPVAEPTAAPSRAPRVIPSRQTTAAPEDPESPEVPQVPQAPQPYPVPTFRLPESASNANNPFLVIKHVAPSYPPHVPDSVVLEHVGEIRQVGSSSMEDAIVVDTAEDDEARDHNGRLMALPAGVKSAIIASTVICGLAIVGFLTVFIVFRWRQKRALIRARGAILCEQLQRGSFRGRSLSPVLVNVSKSNQGHGGLGGLGGHGQPLPYYSKKDLSSRATSNTASNRHYYLWRSLRKTFQEDDME